MKHYHLKGVQDKNDRIDIYKPSRNLAKKRKPYYEVLYQSRAKPGAALQTPPSLIHSLTHPLVPAALRRRHGQTVRDSSSSYKIDYVIGTKIFINPEGHHNRIPGSKVTGMV